MLESKREQTATALAFVALFTLIVYLLSGSWTNGGSSNTAYYHDMKSSDYDRDHKLWSYSNDTQLQFLLEEYSAEVLFSARTNLIQHEDRFFRIAIDSNTYGKRFKIPEIDLCRAATLLNLLEVVQNDRVNITLLYPDFLSIVSRTHQLSIDPTFLDRSISSSKGEILIVYTTCNQLSMTILSLQYLRNTAKVADIIVVDDHSTDGTVEFLQKKGFAVISKPKATGLTDSWNIGYRLAVALGYKHVLFTNNDVLLTAGAVHLMHHGLKSYPLVVPLTTDKGSGHHKPQSIMKAHKLKPLFGSFVDDYRNAEFIQESLLRKYVYVPREQRRCPSQHSVSSANKPKFNGFCFGVNIALIEPAAFEANVHLFDPRDRIVGQEDSLTLRMEKAGLVPIILHCAFVFHFKSKTVSAANFTLFQEVMNRNNATVLDKTSYPTVLMSYNSPDGVQTKFKVDIREDLRWYHRDSKDTSAESMMVGPAFIQAMIKASEMKSVGKVAEEAEPDFDVWEGLKCVAKAKYALFPPAKSHESHKLVHHYQHYPEMSWNIRSNPHCVYPSQWQEHCHKLLSDGSFFEPELYAYNKPQTIVIAIAMSDPVATPSAGDVFTAYELGDSLQKLYSHVKVRYLRRGAQWYSPQLLHDVDILITLLDQYDLTKAMSLYMDSSVPNYFEQNEFTCVKSHQIKPTLITIAWIRNWFHRWLAKPWFGNYDLIFTSSQISKSFFDKISDEIGIQAACANGCPHKAQGFTPMALPFDYRAQRIQTVHHAASSSQGDKHRMLLEESDVESHMETLRLFDVETGYEVEGSADGHASYASRRLATTTSTVVSVASTGPPPASAAKTAKPAATATTTTATSSVAAAAAEAARKKAASVNLDWTFYSPRLQVKSYVYPLATSIRHIRTTGGASKGYDALFSIPSNASLSAQELFSGVDYIFTGSYFNVYRRIMDFDPGAIPQWKGRIVGNNWQLANVTQGWKKICTGLLPYETVKEAYKYVQIVIDDANHATFPWGSTNSRVFDALASGALVISNGYIGMTEIFGPAVAAKGLTLPIYRSGQHLGQLLDYYLSHEEERLALVRIMQEVVLVEHSYLRRAKTLADVVAENFNIVFTPKRSTAALLQAAAGGLGGSNAADSSSGEKNGAADALSAQERKKAKRAQRRKEKQLQRQQQQADEEEGGGGGGRGSRRKRGWRRSSDKEEAVDDDAAFEDPNEGNNNALFEDEGDDKKMRRQLASTKDKTKKGATKAEKTTPSTSTTSSKSKAKAADPKKKTAVTESSTAKATATSTKPATKATKPTTPAAKASTTTPATKGKKAAATSTTSKASAAAKHGITVTEPTITRKGQGKGLCIGVRTTARDEEWLPVLVRSLIVQHSKSKYRDQFPIQFFIADTEAETDFTHFLMDMADKHNERFRYPYVQVLVGTQTAHGGVKNSIYGYDDTDRLLELMVSMRRCSTNAGMSPALGNHSQQAHSNNGRTKVAISATYDGDHGSSGLGSRGSGGLRFKYTTTTIPLSSCEWLMFTNGDNMYNAAWFKTVTPLALSDKYDVIGWDFITHHPRGPKNDTPNQRINVALERGFVDLASVMIRAELFGKTNVRFLHESIFTKDMFARDYMTLRNLFPATTPERMHLIHQVLLLHQ